MKPRLLDLFCGAGGCSMGYYRAGFEVVGVDIAPQKHYPFEFHQADAFEYLRERGHEFDVIHASPPCQSYSKAFKHLAKKQPMLIDECRRSLNNTGRYWIIENVIGSPLESKSNLFGAHGLLLCGTMFGLRVIRHRIFETSLQINCGLRCNHTGRELNPHNSESRKKIYSEFGKQDAEKLYSIEMGVHWMIGGNKHGFRNAIPPAYTEYIGKQLMNALNLQEATS